MNDEKNSGDEENLPEIDITSVKSHVIMTSGYNACVYLNRWMCERMDTKVDPHLVVKTSRDFLKGRLVIMFVTMNKDEGIVSVICSPNRKITDFKQ